TDQVGRCRLNRMSVSPLRWRRKGCVHFWPIHFRPWPKRQSSLRGSACIAIRTTEISGSQQTPSDRDLSSLQVTADMDLNSPPSWARLLPTLPKKNPTLSCPNFDGDQRSVRAQPGKQPDSHRKRSPLVRRPV